MEQGAILTGWQNRAGRTGLAEQGWQVEAVDHDVAAIAQLQGRPGISAHVVDLKQEVWPLAGRLYDGIVVTRYLHRPLLKLLPDCLRDGGVLIYETFMTGNARFGRPRSPEFLLQPDELRQAFAMLKMVAFEQGEEQLPRPAVMQRICAIREVCR